MILFGLSFWLLAELMKLGSRISGYEETLPFE